MPLPPKIGSGNRNPTVHPVVPCLMASQCTQSSWIILRRSNTRMSRSKIMLERENSTDLIVKNNHGQSHCRKSNVILIVCCSQNMTETTWNILLTLSNDWMETKESWGLWSNWLIQSRAQVTVILVNVKKSLETNGTSWNDSCLPTDRRKCRKRILWVCAVCATC